MWDIGETVLASITLLLLVLVVLSLPLGEIMVSDFNSHLLSIHCGDLSIPKQSYSFATAAFERELESFASAYFEK